MNETIKKPTTEEALAHYGVKGMRWGVRRSNPSGSSGPGFKERRATKAQDKLGQKAKSKAAEARAASRANDKGIQDIKKKGSNSDIYKALQEKAYADAYNDAMRRGYGAFSATINAGIMSSTYTRDSAIKELSQTKAGNDAAAKIWAKRSKAIAAVDVSQASKRDVKKAYRS